MERAVRHFADQLIGIRHGAIGPGVIDTVRAECDGQLLPIQHVAWVQADGQRILVQPFDPRWLGAISAALTQAGFNAYIYSKTQVVVSVNPLSGQQRHLVKRQIAKLAEEAKVAVRNIRRKVRQHSGREELTQIDEALQRLTDEMIAKIDRLAEAKVASLT